MRGRSMVISRSRVWPNGGVGAEKTSKLYKGIQRLSNVRNSFSITLHYILFSNFVLEVFAEE